MRRYIPAKKLIEYIESRRDGALERQKNLERIGQETVLNEMIAAELNRLISFITSLQQEQPEVDLEKEMEKFGERWPYPASFDGYDKDWVDELVEECAKHFYDLGLNARKEDK